MTRAALAVKIVQPVVKPFRWPKEHIHAAGSPVAGKSILITKEMWRTFPWHCTTELEWRHCPECGSTLCIPAEEAKR